MIWRRSTFRDVQPAQTTAKTYLMAMDRNRYGPWAPGRERQRPQMLNTAVRDIALVGTDGHAPTGSALALLEHPPPWSRLG
jgi:hypothetical protein